MSLSIIYLHDPSTWKEWRSQAYPHRSSELLLPSSQVNYCRYIAKYEVHKVGLVKHDGRMNINLQTMSKCFTGQPLRGVQTYDFFFYCDWLKSRLNHKVAAFRYIGLANGANTKCRDPVSSIDHATTIGEVIWNDCLWSIFGVQYEVVRAKFICF